MRNMMNLSIDSMSINNDRADRSSLSHAILPFNFSGSFISFPRERYIVS
jgi:hypothetical protein